ncbi:hypothetical protein YC2023_019817 [Brassica napus]
MDFKTDLLDFQKAKNEEKSPRKYGVMAQFSKPVKPVLQLPNLESHREVSKHLRSISSDSGGVEEFLPCTKAHIDQEDLFMATLALFGVSSIQTPTALFSFISGRDQHLPNSKEDSKEAQLSLKTVQVQDYLSSPFASQIPTITPTASFRFYVFGVLCEIQEPCDTY